MNASWISTVAVALFLFGCGGPSSGGSTPEAVAKALASAYTNGDAKAAMALLPSDEAFKAAWDCPADAKLAKRLKRRRDRADKEFSKAKEKGISMSVKSFTAEPKTTTVVKKGEKHKGCTAKVDVTIQKHRLKLLIKIGEKEEDDGETWKFAKFGDNDTWYFFKL
jgi:hypothetical protein